MSTLAEYDASIRELDKQRIRQLETQLEAAHELITELEMMLAVERGEVRTREAIEEMNAEYDR